MSKHAGPKLTSRKLAGSAGAPVLAVLAGVWWGAAGSAPAAAQPRTSDCSLAVDKTASPPIVLLGDEVEVRLAIEASCPAVPASIDAVLVIDQSSSMRDAGKMDNAKNAARAFLDAVELGPSRVGLVAFNQVAGLRSPLTTDGAALARAVQGLLPGGQTNVSAGIELARTELERDPSGARPAMIVLTDGYNTAPGAEPIPVAAARAHGAGITVAAICAGGECDPDLAAAASEPDLYFNVRDSALLADLYRKLAGSLQANALVSVVVRDELPANMDYVSGSAVPVPTRVRGTVLEWEFAGEPPAEIVYRVRPRQTGRLPTNVAARADFTDRQGAIGGADFPVPFVRVVASPGCVPAPLEVMFLIDESNCLYGQELNGTDARTAIKMGVESVLALMDLSSDRAAVIGFGDRAITFQTLTSDPQLILDAVDRIAMRDSWARLDYAFQAVAREMETARHDPAATVVTIIVTDGPMMQAPELAELQGQALRRAGVRHYSIGVGFVTQHAVLRTLSEPGGYFEIPFGGDVITPYQLIGEAVVSLGESCHPAGGATPTPWSVPVPPVSVYLPVALAYRP